MCPDVHCMRHSRKDGHDVYFKFHEPQPDLLNAATHERRARTVTISAELSDAQVTLFRKAEQPKLDAAMSMLDKLAFGKWEEMHENARYAVMGQVLDAAYPGLRDAVEQVLRAGGGK